MDTQQTDYRPLTDNTQKSNKTALSRFPYKRKRSERRADQALSAVLSSTGLFTAKQITDVINSQTDKYQITISQVQQDIKTGLKRYEEIAPDDPKEARLLQAARLDMLRTLALDAYIDSQVQVTETVTTDNDGKERRTKSTKKSAPDAKYLALIVQIEVERNKILGVYSPERKEERQDLTVTFAWRESERLPEAQTVEYATLVNSLAEDEK